MIVIAGLLLALAMPSYGEYVRRSARNDARRMLRVRDVSREYPKDRCWSR